MKNGLLFEFMKLNEKRTFFHELDDDDFAKEVPDNSFTGDIHIPDHDNIDSDNSLDSETDIKREKRAELAKDVPDNDFIGDPLDSDILGDESNIDTFDSLPQQNIEPSQYPSFDQMDQIPEEDDAEIVPEQQSSPTNLQQPPPPPNMDMGGSDMMQPPQGGMADQNMMDPNMMGGDPNMMGGMAPGMGAPGMMDPNMMGGMMGPQPLDPGNIGKVFILKKIYTRLISVQENLDKLCGAEFDEIKSHVSESIEHFQNVIKNFDQFKDKLDEIISLYQRFLVSVVNKVERILGNNNQNFYD